MRVCLFSIKGAGTARRVQPVGNNGGYIQSSCAVQEQQHNNLKSGLRRCKVSKKRRRATLKQRWLGNYDSCACTQQCFYYPMSLPKGLSQNVCLEYQPALMPSSVHPMLRSRTNVRESDPTWASTDDSSGLTAVPWGSEHRQNPNKGASGVGWVI